MPGDISRSYSGPKNGRVPTWMDQSRDAREFLAWLMEDREYVEAEVGTPRDEKLQYFASKGMLKLYRCIKDTNSYAITSEWIKGLA